MADEVRLIDANALKEDFLNDWTNSMMESLRGNHHEVIRIEDVIEQIEDAPTIEAEPDKGWISVKDRLPEDDGKYMVWYKGELDICEFDTDSQTFGYTYDDYDEMYSHRVLWDDCMDKYVTHWQHLPERPKEGDAE